VIKGYTEPPKGTRLAPDKIQKLVQRRSELFGIAVEGAQRRSPNVPQQALIHATAQVIPFDYTIRIQDAILPGLASNPEVLGECWSKYQHLNLIELALRLQLPQPPKPSNDNLEIVRLHQYAQSALIKFCRETVSITHPKEAKILSQPLPIIQFVSQEELIGLSMKGR
jgi:hypothetical protein